MTINLTPTMSISCDGPAHIGPDSYIIEVDPMYAMNERLRRAGWGVSRDGKGHLCKLCLDVKRRAN